MAKDERQTLAAYIAAHDLDPEDGGDREWFRPTECYLIAEGADIAIFGYDDGSDEIYLLLGSASSLLVDRAGLPDDARKTTIDAIR